MYLTLPYSRLTFISIFSKKKKKHLLLLYTFKNMHIYQGLILDQGCSKSI